MSFQFRCTLLPLFCLVLAGCDTTPLTTTAFPPPNAKDPLSGMGVNIHFTDPKPGELEMLAQGGFRWVRMDFWWGGTEKSPGVYDFSAYDRLLEALDRNHLRALLILDYTNSLYDEGKPTHTEAGRAAFARWAVAAATHFRSRGVIWEIWNEPNGAWFWKPAANAEDYALLALAVSKAMHEAVPGEMIVGPALSGFNMDFVEVAAKKGVLAYWSAITIHPYIRLGPENYGKAYEATRALIRKYELPGQHLDVMCGESGYTTTWPGIDDETQGKYLARLFLFDVMSDVPLTIWYDWHDDGDNPKDSESNFGIVRYAYHAGAAQVFDPKPAYLAAQTYARQLAGYHFKERLETASKDDYVLAFSHRSGTCRAAWTAGAPHELSIPASDGTYAVTGYDGRKLPSVEAVDGVLRLTVDGGPQYFKRQ